MMKQTAVTQVTQSFNIKSRQIRWDLAGATKCKPTNQLTLPKLSTHLSFRHPEAKAMSVFLKHSSLSVRLRMRLLTPQNYLEITFDENTAHTSEVPFKKKKRSYPEERQQNRGFIIVNYFKTSDTSETLPLVELYTKSHTQFKPTH